MNKENVSVKLLYIHNRDNAWGFFEGDIKLHHYHLLQIEDKGGHWSPHHNGMLNAQYALLSFFIDTYPPEEWFEGDPIDHAQEWIDTAPGLLSEDFVFEIRERINEEINSFDFTLEHSDVEHKLLGEVTAAYTEHLKKTLESNPHELVSELSKTIENLENTGFKLKQQRPSRDSSPIRK